MSATRGTERCSSPVWNWGPLLALDDLIAVVAADVDTAWADQILASDERRRVVWVAAVLQPERDGRAALARAGVHAASLAAAGQPPGQVGMALQVASYLARVRSAGCSPTRAYLTSPSRPVATPDGLVRIPHLVTVRAADETTRDEVVWKPARPAEPAWRRPHRRRARHPRGPTAGGAAARPARAAVDPTGVPAPRPVPGPVRQSGRPDMTRMTAAPTIYVRQWCADTYRGHPQCRGGPR